MPKAKIITYTSMENFSNTSNVSNKTHRKIQFLRIKDEIKSLYIKKNIYTVANCVGCD